MLREIVLLFNLELIIAVDFLGSNYAIGFMKININLILIY